MYCPKCGAELKDGSMFCGKCGASIGERLDNSLPMPKSDETSNVEKRIDVDAISHKAKDALCFATDWGKAYIDKAKDFVNGPKNKEKASNFYNKVADKIQQVGDCLRGKNDESILCSQQATTEPASQASGDVVESEKAKNILKKIAEKNYDVYKQIANLIPQVGIFLKRKTAILSYNAKRNLSFASTTFLVLALFSSIPKGGSSEIRSKELKGSSSSSKGDKYRICGSCEGTGTCCTCKGLGYKIVNMSGVNLKWECLTCMNTGVCAHCKGAGYYKSRF